MTARPLPPPSVSCTYKKRFQLWQQANDAIHRGDRRLRPKGLKLTIYRCLHCGGYHLGSSGRRS
jgi:hypothetical protein